MTNKNLIILAIAAVVLVILTAALYSSKPESTTKFTAGSLLIQGLDVDKIGSITVTRNDETATLIRDGDEFTLAEKNGYPASLEKVNNLIIDCLDIRRREITTHSPENHIGLGVAEGGEQTVSVKFFDKETNLLLGILKGHPIEKRAGFYVRLADDDTVYASEELLDVPIGPIAFMDTSLISLSKADVERVDVTTDVTSYTISRNAGDNITLQNVPEGKQVKASTHEEVFAALVNLSFTDVVPIDEIKADWNGTYTCKLKNGLAYTVQTAEVDNKTYARLSAKGPGLTRVTISKTDSEEELKKKEALLLAAEEAENFTPKHAIWAYEISTWNAGKLRKPFSELVEDIATPEAQD